RPARPGACGAGPVRGRGRARCRGDAAPGRAAAAAPGGLSAGTAGAGPGPGPARRAGLRPARGSGTPAPGLRRGPAPRRQAAHGAAHDPHPRAGTGGSRAQASGRGAGPVVLVGLLLDIGRAQGEVDLLLHPRALVVLEVHAAGQAHELLVELLRALLQADLVLDVPQPLVDRLEPGTQLGDIAV